MKDEYITFRVDRVTHIMLKAFAHTKNLTVSDVVRTLCSVLTAKMLEAEPTQTELLDGFEGAPEAPKQPWGTKPSARKHTEPPTDSDNGWCKR